MREWLRSLVRSAGAPSEADTDRDGAFSYKSETHAVGYGLALGVGIALAQAGWPYVLELMLASVGGLGIKRKRRNERVWREITDEPQYFLPMIVVGLLVGTAIASVLSPAMLVAFV